MTRREIVDRLEVEARRRAAIQAELHRPWLCDSEPDMAEVIREAQSSSRMLAWVLLLLICVVVGGACYGIGVLSVRAFDAEMETQQQADCLRLATVQGAQVPTYCGEGK